MKSILAFLILGISVSAVFAVPAPKIYLPFENTDGFFDKTDPAWINCAPGWGDQLWYAERGRLSSNSQVPNMMPVIAQSVGVDGSNCMDLTATNANQQLGSLFYGNLPNTADSWFSNTPAEDAFDDASSYTIYGWYNTGDSSVYIGQGDQSGARLLNKYGQAQLMVNQGRLALYIGNGASWVYSSWGSYTAEDHKGKWVMFAVTYDGTIGGTDDNVKFYVATPNSPVSLISAGSTGTVRGPITWNSGQYMIVGNYGIGSTHGNSSFKGYLDNFRVFSSHADESGALGLNDLELFRQIDLGMLQPDDSLLYMDGDIDKNYSVDADDLNALAEEWLADGNISIDAPTVYLSFDNSDGIPFDENDPAFANQGTAGAGEQPSMIMRIPSTDPNYAQYPDGISLSVNPDGISGSCLDLTNRPMAGLGSMLVYGNTDSASTDTGMQQALDWPLSLTVTCWWKHSQASAMNVSDIEEGAFLLHRIGELSFWASKRSEPTYGYFGEIGFTPNDEDQYSGNMIFSPWMYPESEQWVFFAFTLDTLLDQTDKSVGRIKWYRGTIDQSVTLHTQVQFSLDEIMAPGPGNPLVIGNSNYEEATAVNNFAALIDELRIYASSTGSSAALDVSQLEAIRNKDAEAFINKKADINKDGDVDLLDFTALANNWLETGTPYSMLPFDTELAAIYFPFENDNGSYGYGSADNPAWENAVLGEAPNYIGNDQPNYPTITSDGIKGDALFASDSSKEGLSTVTYSWTSSTKDAFSQAQSYTICGWMNTRDAAKNGSETYLCRSMSAGPMLRWRSDGRLQFMDSVDGSWRYSSWGEGESLGEWVFFAVTRDSSSVRFYFGSEEQVVSAGDAPITGLFLTKTGDSTRFILGGSTYNGTDKYLNCDLDEIRIFTSKVDDSGALTVDALEDVRKFDMGL